MSRVSVTSIVEPCGAPDPGDNKRARLERERERERERECVSHRRPVAISDRLDPSSSWLYAWDVGQRWRTRGRDFAASRRVKYRVESPAAGQTFGDRCWPPIDSRCGGNWSDLDRESSLPPGLDRKNLVQLAMSKIYSFGIPFGFLAIPPPGEYFADRRSTGQVCRIWEMPQLQFTHSAVGIPI